MASLRSDRGRLGLPKIEQHQIDFQGSQA